MARRVDTPEGTRDLVNEQCFQKEKVVNMLNNLFRSWGYKEVSTSSLEYYDTFNINNHGFRAEDMYKFFDSKGSILVLRPDMTIPMARVVATKLKEEDIPLRLRYTSNIFRVHESLGGKRNEYTTSGIELFGLDEVNSDIEAIVLAVNSLKNNNFKDFKIEIGHIGLFNSIFEGICISDDEKEEIASLIERKRLSELEEALNKLSIDNNEKELIKKLPWLFGDSKILEQGKKLALKNSTIEHINYLENLYKALCEIGLGEYISFDLSMVPKLNYYTGIIFKGYVNGAGNYVLYGGRYNDLVKAFGRDINAVGFSINVDALAELTNFDDENKKCILYYEQDKYLIAIRKSETLRNEGWSVELSPIKDDKKNNNEIQSFYCV